METDDENVAVPWYRRTWYRKLIRKIETSEPDDNTTYFLTLVGWKQPPRLADEQNFQLCSILYSQLLTVGATPQDFEAALADPEFYDAVDFVHSFKADDEEYPVRENLRVVKCSFVGKDATANVVVRQQCIQLVLATLGMFGIPVDEFIQTMNRGWMESLMENNPGSDAR